MLKNLYHTLNKNLTMINLSKAQVSWDSQVIAFKWYQNIGDALSHFAHFSSFLSETQRQEAFNIIASYSNMPSMYYEDYTELYRNVQIAPIKADKPSLTKTKP
jgi:hypothetical protein